MKMVLAGSLCQKTYTNNLLTLQTDMTIGEDEQKHSICTFIVLTLSVIALMSGPLSFPIEYVENGH
jgi:hypothetical protein